ncbi:SWIM zinc finger family protein [Palaeococcus ferrophilus]|uniref:SWIM zinc finger family protein n=1 Tax=Palaeococcus ferrophilus TaxID=83868 RepID=UPI00064EAB0A|nr:SWIM zinc finger family protein [Palaeococcus ferrophilus]
MSRKPEALWCLRIGERLFARVLGTYPYEVEVNLRSGWNRCTCPLGGDCKHVRAALEAYREGNFVEGEEWMAFEPSSAVGVIASENPSRAMEILLRELELSLKTDESGSRSAGIFWRAIGLLKMSNLIEFEEEKLRALFVEFRDTFEGYPAVERIGRELASLGLVPRE